MARARSIKPGFFKNEELAELGPEAMLLFAGLWTIADRSGRLEDRPKRIKAEVLPYFRRVNVESLLSRLASRNFIVRYVVGSERYIAIPTWDKHQNPHIREALSEIPAPPEHSASTVPSTSPALPFPERAGLTPSSLTPSSLTPSSLTPLTLGTPPQPAARVRALPTPQNSRFREWLDGYRGRKADPDGALRAWISVDGDLHADAAFACRDRYNASAEVERGALTEAGKFIFQQGGNGWSGQWPRARDSPGSSPRKLSTLERAIQEART